MKSIHYQSKNGINTINYDHIFDKMNVVNNKPYYHRIYVNRKIVDNQIMTYWHAPPDYTYTSDYETTTLQFNEFFNGKLRQQIPVYVSFDEDNYVTHISQEFNTGMNVVKVVVDNHAPCTINKIDKIDKPDKSNKFNKLSNNVDQSQIITIINALDDMKNDINKSFAKIYTVFNTINVAENAESTNVVDNKINNVNSINSTPSVNVIDNKINIVEDVICPSNIVINSNKLTNVKLHRTKLDILFEKIKLIKTIINKFKDIKRCCIKPKYGSWDNTIDVRCHSCNCDVCKYVKDTFIRIVNIIITNRIENMTELENIIEIDETIRQMNAHIDNLTTKKITNGLIFKTTQIPKNNEVHSFVYSAEYIIDKLLNINIPDIDIDNELIKPEMITSIHDIDSYYDDLIKNEQKCEMETVYTKNIYDDIYERIEAILNNLFHFMRDTTPDNANSTILMAELKELIVTCFYENANERLSM